MFPDSLYVAATVHIDFEGAPNVTFLRKLSVTYNE
jgi:hypothetical protein